MYYEFRWLRPEQAKIYEANLYNAYRLTPQADTLHLDRRLFGTLMAVGNVIPCLVAHVTPDGDEIVATAGFQLLDNPREIVWMWLIGQGLKDWAYDFSFEVDRMLHMYEGERVIVQGRKGLKRFLRDYQRRFGDRLKVNDHGIFSRIKQESKPELVLRLQHEPRGIARHVATVDMGAATRLP